MERILVALEDINGRYGLSERIVPRGATQPTEPYLLRLDSFALSDSICKSFQFVRMGRQCVEVPQQYGNLHARFARRSKIQFAPRLEINRQPVDVEKLISDVIRNSISGSRLFKFIRWIRCNFFTRSRIPFLFSKSYYPPE